MYKPVIYTLFFLFHLHSYSQSVENVRFNQAGEKIFIFYDLDDISGEKTLFSVKVFYTLDDGRTYIPVKSAYGDIGNDIDPGQDKKVIWDVLNDTDELTGEIKFKVTVSPQKVTAFKQKETTILDYDLFIGLRTMGLYWPFGGRIGMLGPGWVGGYASFIYGVEYVEWDEKYLVVGGPIFNIINKDKIRLSTFAGGGYYEEYFSDGDYGWDYDGGFVIEGGFIFTYKHLGFTIGLEIDEWVYLYPFIGVGFTL
ncbi:MAG: hypothetical protein JSV22_05595 [Bacteroidales bacterium]|nr:MAG: hypothetical protein JSV22_05595 [Bacteroidales bacterium]